MMSTLQTPTSCSRSSMDKPHSVTGRPPINNDFTNDANGDSSSNALISAFMLSESRFRMCRITCHVKRIRFMGLYVGAKVSPVIVTFPKCDAIDPQKFPLQLLMESCHFLLVSIFPEEDQLTTANSEIANCSMVELTIFSGCESSQSIRVTPPVARLTQ